MTFEIAVRQFQRQLERFERESIYLGLIMRSIFILFVTIISANVFAGEIVKLKADMTLVRCEYSNNSATCSTPISYGQPIQIDLTTSPGSNTPSGDFKFKTTQDEFEFEGTVSVTKFSVGNHSRYLIQTYVASIKGVDFDTLNFDFLGSVSVNNVSELNDISWSGQTIRESNITLTPKIIVGTADADLSFISSVKSAK
jgi:hypothetical protein